MILAIDLANQPTFKNRIREVWFGFFVYDLRRVLNNL